MIDSPPTEGYIRVANRVMEAIMLRDFSKHQRKILDLIYRLSYGCNKASAVIPRQRDFEIVGIYENDVKREILWLEASKIIHKEGSNYYFNTQFEEWQVSRVRKFDPSRLSELLSMNLETIDETPRQKARELRETRSGNFAKREEKTSRNAKTATLEPESPKDTIKDTIIPLPNGNGQRGQTEKKKGEHKTSDPRVREITQRMERYLGYPEKVSTPPLANYGAEAKAIRVMLDKGYEAEDIYACWESRMQGRSQFVTMAFVHQDLPVFLKNNRGGRVNPSTPSFIPGLIVEE